MPITVTAPQGELTESGRREILPRLTAALLDASEASGSAFFANLTGGTVRVLPAEDIYAGGVNRRIVLVEVKLPNIGLADLAQRAAFIGAAADVVDQLTVGTHRRQDTWVNIVNAPDGGWGIGGRAYTGDDLVAAAAE